MGESLPGGWPARAGRMREPAFRAAQFAGRYAPHVAALNRFVDTLGREAGRAPAVPPMYGGSAARVVNVVGPPPAHAGPSRTAFVCWENDDEAAARHRCLSGSAGLTASDVLDWPVLPWPVARTMTAGELDQARRILLTVLGMLTAPRVVLFHGRQAGRLRRTLDRFGPGWDSSRGLVVVQTGGVDPTDDPADPQERLARLATLVAEYHQAGRVLGRTCDPDTPCLAQLARRLAAQAGPVGPAAGGEGGTDPVEGGPAGADALVTAVADIVGIDLGTRRADGGWNGRFRGPAAWWGRDVVVRRVPATAADPRGPDGPDVGAETPTPTSEVTPALVLAVTVEEGLPARLYRPAIPPRLRFIDLIQRSSQGAGSTTSLYRPSAAEHADGVHGAADPPAEGPPTAVPLLDRDQRRRLDRYAALD